jgi:Opacity family porin protein
MKLAELIAIAAVASILTQTSVFAQENPPAVVPVPEKTPATEKPKSDPDKVPATEKPNSAPAPEKKYSIGPAIEFGGGGTNFGITGKYPLSENFSVRPIVLFGRKTNVTTSNLTQAIGGSYTANDINAIAQNVDNFSGLAYGISATYDFKSADSKIAGYIGPRILSTAVSVTGTKGFTPVQIDISEINVGLTAGADFAITPDLTAGLNATYNLYRGVRIDSTNIQNPGSTTNFGINVTYNF